MTQAPDRQSHYYLQLNRRFKFLEEWRKIRRELAKGSKVRMVHSPVRRAKLGMLVGRPDGIPTRMIDARLMEIPPGGATSTHRHLHDAMIFVLDGRGASTIDGARLEWARWDALHTPSWTWHRHENLDSEAPARLLAITDAPLLAALRLNKIEEIGDADPPDEPRPPALPVEVVPSAGGSFYERELALADESETEREAATKLTRFADLTLRVSPRGTRTALLVDGSLGHKTSGLSMAMFQIPPGKGQAKHRHPGEAILYIVDGRGYSVIEDQRHDWETGDAVLVHQYCWHQHFNADPDHPAVVIRMHMWESIIEMMQAAMDPIPLYEDDPAMHRQGATWDQPTPEAASPSAPA